MFRLALRKHHSKVFQKKLLSALFAFLLLFQNFAPVAQLGIVMAQESTESVVEVTQATPVPEATPVSESTPTPETPPVPLMTTEPTATPIDAASPKSTQSENSESAAPSTDSSNASNPDNTQYPSFNPTDILAIPLNIPTFPSPEVAPEVLPPTEQECVIDNSQITQSQETDWDSNLEEGISTTKENVKLGVKYVFPQENKVSVTFKCLPKDESLRKPLKIQQIKVSDLKLPQDISVDGDYAYDITTDMRDGDFQYDISLPKSENKSVAIKYIEKSVEEVTTASEALTDEDIQTIDEAVTQKTDSIEATGVDHFTIVFVSSTMSVFADFNGATQVTVYPGTSINVSMTVQTFGSGSVDNWQRSQYLIEGGSWTCVNTDNNDGDNTYTETISIVAPTTVGTYDLSLRAYIDDSCSGTFDDFVLSDAIIVTDAATIPFTESFGSSNSSAVPNWYELEPAEVISGSGDDTPTDSKFAKIGDNGWICRPFNLTSVSSVQLSYDWKGDSHAESNDFGVVEYKANGSCGDSNGWTSLAANPLNDTSWGNQTHTFPGNNLINLRFRTNANNSNEYFRVDSLSLTATPQPDLVVTKTNDVNGTVTVNAPFRWILHVENIGTATADFDEGETILLDNLPSDDGAVSYGSPIVDNLSGITENGGIICNISPFENLTCSVSSGGGVRFVDIAPGGSFDVSFTVTPTEMGELVNPRSGHRNICRIDPDTDVTESNESNNNCSDRVTVTTVPPVANPPLPQACGLDIALVLDSSGSVNGGELSTMKTAFKEFVNALLPATPTQFSVTDFDTTAAVLQAFSGSAATVNTAIDLPTSGGSTNWEDGLLKAQSTLPNRSNPDLVIFASDGNPNRVDNGTSVSETQALAEAVTVANAIKTSGARMLAMGIGNNLDLDNLKAISGPTVGTDLSADVITSDFDTLAATLADFAADTCGGTISVNKYIDTVSEATKGGSNWMFNVRGPDSYSKDLSTDVDGKANTGTIPANSGYSLVEYADQIPSGYSFSSAVCRDQAGNPVGKAFVDQAGNSGVENINVVDTAIISCEVINTTRPPQSCGDGDVNQQSEQCDYGSLNGQSSCSAQCTWVNECREVMAANGSFETPVVTNTAKWDAFDNAEVPGWTADWYGGSSSYSGHTRPDPQIELHNGVLGSAAAGNQYAELDSDWGGPDENYSGEPSSITLSQSIPTIIGNQYTVSWKYAARPNHSNNHLQVKVGGTEVFNSGVIAGGGSINWLSETYTFTATTGLTTITFAELGVADSFGMFLDDVTVSCEGPTNSDITVCKKDPNGATLPGWQVQLYKPNAVANVFVPSTTGTAVSFAPVVAGDYILRATGQYAYRPSSPGAEYSDAGWSKRDPGDAVYGGAFVPWVKVATFPAPHTGWLGVMVNDDTADWGDYFNPTHLYVKNFENYAGGVISAKILDDVYSDNSGGVSLDLHEGYTGITGENGCVTFEDVPYGEYYLDEIERDDWEYVSGSGPVTIDDAQELFEIINREILKPVTIVASKVVCESESYLPNWHNGANINASTAQNFVDNSNGKCWLDDGWNFQWGFADKKGAEGVDKLSGEVLGEAAGQSSAGMCNTPWCGPNTFTGSAYNQWKTFGTTNGSGVAEVTITDLENAPGIWVREVLQPNYVPYSYPPDSSPGSNVSAELYCHTDVANYDNFDQISSPQYGQTYYCVALNAQKGSIHGYKWDDVNGDGKRQTCDTFRVTEQVIDEVDQECVTEDLLSGWSIDLYRITKDEDEEVKTLIDTKVTDGGDEHFGWYWFDNLPFGEYEVCEQLQPGWVQTYPESPVCHRVNLPDDNSNGFAVVLNAVEGPTYNFGNQRVGRLLLSKANNVYPTIRAPGDTIKYTLTVIGKDGPLENVIVTDVPPDGFNYVLGSWTAFSSLRGDLKNTVTTEPTYGSPGDWLLGNMEPEEVVTLTYDAKIENEITAGTHPDLAYAAGNQIGGLPVYAQAQDPGFVSDEYAGTQVQVAVNNPGGTLGYDVERKETVTAQVLGASTELPATGMPLTMPLIGFGVFLTGLVTLLTGLFIRRRHVLARTAAGLGVALVIIIGCVTPASAMNSLSLRVEQLPSPYNQKEFKLRYVVLDIDNRPITVTCFRKAPDAADFSPFSSPTAIQAGGDNHYCNVTSDMTGRAGTYQFYVVANAGADTFTSPIQAVDLWSNTGPGTPTNYSRQRESCKDRLTFRAADDGGKTNRIEVYRSDNRSFTADSGSRIDNFGASSNENFTKDYDRPDCGKTYYFVLRAFDSSNNGSGLVGDTETIVTTTTTTTTTTSPTTVTGALPVIDIGASTGVSTGGTGSILGESDDIETHIDLNGDGFIDDEELAIAATKSAQASAAARIKAERDATREGEATQGEVLGSSFSNFFSSIGGFFQWLINWFKSLFS